MDDSQLIAGEFQVANRAIIHRIRHIKASIFMKTVGSELGTPENAERMWKAAGLDEDFGGITFDRNVENPNILRGVSESGQYGWEWDTSKPGGPKIHDFSKEVGLKGVGRGKTSDLKTAWKMFQNNWGTGTDELGMEIKVNPEEEIVKAVTDPNHPRHEQALLEYPSYQAMKGRWDEIMGIEGRQFPPTAEERSVQQAGPYGAGYDYAQPSTGLAGVGQPRGAQQGQRRIIRTGTDPDTGRRIVMYEDGTLEYAD